MGIRVTMVLRMGAGHTLVGLVMEHSWIIVRLVVAMIGCGRIGVVLVAVS